MGVEHVLQVMHPLFASKSRRLLSLLVVVFFTLLAINNIAKPRVFQVTVGDLTDAAFSIRRNRLHFLLPASKADLNLCKAFVSATLLGYPVPTIVNWDPTGDEKKSGGRAARQMEKLSSVSNYLNRIVAHAPGDLILMVDSLDTWFQLPPSVLLERFEALNTRANEIINSRQGRSAARNVSQKIVFSAEKKCWPRLRDEMGCGAMPESPLPRDLYGPQTDNSNEPIPEDYYGQSTKKKLPDQEPLFRHIRPRFLNSGFALGPIKEARELFDRAHQLAVQDPTVYGADQGIIAQMFGEQSYMRERQRSAVSPPWKRGKLEEFVPESGRQYEFNIGLDYEQSLGLPTAFSERDTAWVIHKDTEAIRAKARELHVTVPRILDQGLSPDIAALPPPLSGVGDSDVRSFAELPLFTNFWTGISPVTIHLNAIHHGVKRLRDEAWWRMWFAADASRLFESQRSQLEAHDSDQVPLTSNGGTKFYGFLPLTNIREFGYGAVTLSPQGKEGWIQWDEICNAESQREVFNFSKAW